MGVLLFSLFSNIPSSQVFANDPGSPENPHIITTCQELQDMSNDLDAHYALGGDIDCSASSSWDEMRGFEPIGGYDEFTGSFDGGGFTISDIYINRPDDYQVGFFGYTAGAEISNINLTNVDIIGSGIVGGLIGYAEETSIINVVVDGRVEAVYNEPAMMFKGQVGGLVGLIDGCYAGSYSIVNSHTSGTVIGGHLIGGLGGWVQCVDVSDSSSSSNIISSSIEGGSAGYQVGGLIGSYEGTYSNRVELIRSFATGSVSTDASGGEIGGLIGNVYYGNIEQSFATGNVEGGYAVGGLIGVIDGSNEISNTYARGSVHSFDGEDYWGTGGLIGHGYTELYNSYSTGEVSGVSSLLGGLFGKSYADESEGIVLNNYWDTQTSNQSSSDEGEGKSTAEMKQEITFSGWDFVNIWSIDSEENDGYPTFDWFLNLEGGNGGEEPPIYDDGDGSPEDPFIITSCEQLQAMNQDLAAHYALDNDIDCSETTTWNEDPENPGTYFGFDPVGEIWGDPFVGTLEGNNYVVSNLYISLPTNKPVGIFSFTSDGFEASNLGIVNANISGVTSIGGFIGYAEYSTIRNCWFEGNVVMFSEDFPFNQVDVGGLIGQVYEGTVENSYSTGTVTGNYNAGGLIGQGDEAIINSSYSSSEVVGDSYAGGLVGFNWSSTINNSYALGDVSADNRVGGLVGASWGSGGVISNSFSVGSVSGSSDVGGLVGNNSAPELTTNSYWNIESSNQTESEGGEGKTTQEMQQLSTFNAWDIATSTTDLNNGYPYLAWQAEDETSTWLIYEDSIYDDGDGSPEDPFIITSCEQLQAMNQDLAAHYALDNDIDCSETTTWNEDPENPGTYFGFDPVGGTDWGDSFIGTLEGNNYVVSNLYIRQMRESPTGLFGYTEEGFEISNIGLEDAYIGGPSYVGGLVGFSDTPLINNCWFDGDIDFYDIGQMFPQYFGSLAGFVMGGSIQNSYSLGSVEGPDYAGGIAGFIDSGSVISSSYSLSEINGDYAVGGLVGFSWGSTITNSYSLGNATGDDAVGGLVGEINSSNISNSFSVGVVDGNHNFGGLIGLQDSSTITNSYWNIESSNQTESEGGEGKTTQEMQQLSTFNAWDIATSTTDLNNGYPYLAWQAEDETSTWLIYEEEFIDDGSDEEDDGGDDDLPDPDDDESRDAEDMIIYDGKVLINPNSSRTKSAKWTNKREVDLYLTAKSSHGTIVETKISLNSDLSGASWEDYQEMQKFTLADKDGPQTVYVKFKDTRGIRSEIYSREIILDRHAPWIQLTRVGSIDYNPNYSNYYLNTQEVSLLGFAEENTRVIVMVDDEEQVSLPRLTNIETWEAILALNAGQNEIQVIGEDEAGNQTEPIELNIIVGSSSSTDPIGPPSSPTPGPGDPNYPVDPSDPTIPTDPVDPSDPVDPEEPPDEDSPADPGDSSGDEEEGDDESQPTVPVVVIEVLDPEGEPVEGVTVKIKELPNLETKKTNSEGRVEFENVYVSDYSVTLRKGLLTQQISLSIGLTTQAYAQTLIYDANYASCWYCWLILLVIIAIVTHIIKKRVGKKQEKENIKKL